MKVSVLTLLIFVSIRLTATAQAPTLTTTLPVRNALAASRTGPVVLTFSQPMSAAAASGNAVKVYSSQRGGLLTRAGGGGTFSGAGTNTISFQPAQSLLPGEVVTVQMTTAASSTVGNALTPLVQQFTVAVSPSNGQFAGGSEVVVPGNPICLTTADVDNDGDLDLVSANRNSANASVSVRLNDGTGVFGGGSDLAIGTRVVSIRAADFDSDGDLDLLIGSDNSIAVRLNYGAGTFGGGSDLPGGPYIRDALAMDIDQDDDLNIAAPLATFSGGTRLGEVVAWLNSGAGQFTNCPSLYRQHLGVMAIGDIDNDGGQDLVLGLERVTPQVIGVRWQQNLPYTQWSGTNLPNDAQCIQLADLNGDGNLDLLTNSGVDSTMNVRFNSGTGAFTGGADYNIAGFRGTTHATTGDVDGDGDLDILIAGTNGTDSVSVWHNDGLGILRPGVKVGVGADPWGIVAADIDGDGDLDLLTANLGTTAHTISVRFNGTHLSGVSEHSPSVFLLVPNPAHRTVRLSNAPVGSVVILDWLGRTVRTATIAAGQTDATLFVEGLPAGLYTVRAGHLARRLVVE